jgi:hypothetical protein
MHQWAKHPNLRLRPAAPARGKGRLQRQIKRAAIASGSREISSTVFYDWCFHRLRMRGERISQRHRHSVWRVLKTIAEPVGRTGSHGAILWRLRAPISSVR